MTKNEDVLYERNDMHYKKLTQWEKKHVKEATKNIINHAKERYVRGTEIELRIGRDIGTMRAYRRIVESMSEKKRHILVNPRISKEPFIGVIELYHDNSEQLIHAIKQLLEEKIKEEELDYTVRIKI